MATVNDIAAKYGHEMQNDAANGKLNEALLHKTIAAAISAQRKIDEGEHAKKVLATQLSVLKMMAKNLSFNEKQKAKEIFKQYKDAPKILGLY